MSTKGNKGSYVVMLENAKLPPKLVASCKPLGDNKFLIYLIHPNTKKVIIEQEVECKDLNEAMKKANELKDLPEAQNVETWYEETLFIPQPKRGKMKLKTKEAVEEEMNAEERVEPKASKAPKKAPAKAKAAPKKVTKTSKTKAVKAKKTVKKPAKGPKKKK